MNIYLVIDEKGRWEDYKEEIVKIFFNKKNALHYIKEKNGKLFLKLEKRNKKLFNKFKCCEICKFRNNTKQSGSKPDCCNCVNWTDKCLDSVDEDDINEWLYERFKRRLLRIDEYETVDKPEIEGEK